MQGSECSLLKQCALQKNGGIYFCLLQAVRGRFGLWQSIGELCT